MSNFRMMLLSTAAIGLTAAAVTPASAGEVEKSVSISGHVARMVGVVDRGDTDEFLHADANRSGSRVVIKGTAASESMTMGTYFRIRMDGSGNESINSSSSASMTTDKSYLYVKTSGGTLSLGDQCAAGCAYEPDSQSKSGASGLGSNFGGAPFGGRFMVKGSPDNETDTSNTAVGGVGTYTGGGGTSIKYSSPDLNGLSFEVGLGGGSSDGGAAEVVSGNVGYSADFDGVAVGAHYVYVSNAGDSTTVAKTQNAGLGVEVNGINAAIGWGNQNMKGASTQDPTVWVGSLGYDSNASDLGETSFRVSYTNDSEGAADTGDFKQWALDIEQNMDDYGTAIFGGVAKQKYSITGTNYEDILTTWVGLKVSF